MSVLSAGPCGSEGHLGCLLSVLSAGVDDSVPSRAQWTVPCGVWVTPDSRAVVSAPCWRENPGNQAVRPAEMCRNPGPSNTRKCRFSVSGNIRGNVEVSVSSAGLHFQFDAGVLVFSTVVCLH